MALIERDKPRGPLQQKALKYAVRRTTLNQPRFADQGGLQDNERALFRKTLDRRYNRFSDKVLPKETPLFEFYKNRLGFLKLPAAKQKEVVADRKERRDIKKYLAGDETYMEQRDLLRKAMQDYGLSLQAQQGRVGEDFGLANERMDQERVKARDDITESNASRGILNSGVFIKGLSDYDTEFQKRVGDLTRSKDRTLEDLLEQQRLFRSENQARLMAARREAIRRRAAEQGIGLSTI